MAVASTDVTQLLLQARGGDREAVDRLLPLVYEELRRIASRRRPRSAADPTLGTTALVHEAYLKLFDRTRLDLVDREHFFAVAAMAMRQIAIDQARRGGASKRGGDRQRVDFEGAWLHCADRADEILAIDQALDRLAQLDERLARVVELRFFAGLTEAEIAEALERDERTVRRDWRKARAILHALLSDDSAT